MLIRPRSKKAFTLLELIVVIVILGLLAALAIPTFARVTRRSQDASTSATISSVLRDARALMAFQEADSSWESSVVTALGETAVPAASGLLAANYSQPGTSGEPTRERPVYSVSSGVVALSMRSDSGNVCVGTASTAASAAPVCGPGFPAGSTPFTAGQAAQGKALADGSFAPLPSDAGGTSTPNPTTTPAPTAPAPSYAGTGRVVTYAGQLNTSGYQDGTLAASRFHHPRGLLSVGTDLYVSEAGNQRIRKVDTLTGKVTTVAGSGADASVDGTGAGASFSYPWGMASDGANLYVVDFDGRKVRKVVLSTGNVTTLAGTGASGASDGAGASSTFGAPTGVTLLGGNLYVADRASNKIRVVSTATGAVSTLPGSYSGPRGLTTDGTNLYVAAAGALYKVDPGTGVSSVLSGSASAAGYVEGSAAQARFDGPYQLTYSAGQLYVADYANNRIRKVDVSTGATTFIAGSGAAASVDGTGSAAAFSAPAGIALLGSDLYVADNGHVIRKIS
jgi:prepilin-type N-terminal cleavage/methylation domain-containing protein